MIKSIIFKMNVHNLKYPLLFTIINTLKSLIILDYLNMSCYKKVYNNNDVYIYTSYRIICI